MQGLHVSNCCILALWLYSKDYQAFAETIPCHRKCVATHPQSDRPLVSTAADDCYVNLWLYHLAAPWCLTAAATRKQYGIHPQTIRNRLRQNVQPIRAYRLYFSQISHPTS